MSALENTMSEPPATDLETYLATLNPEQKKATDQMDGPTLILAGAGTGKTRVLTSRIARLCAEGHCWPSQILAVTFTNKAANEMRERVMRLVGSSGEGLWLGTFHSICARILRRHAECLDLPSHFTILDPEDQLRLIKQLIKSYGLEEKENPPRLMAWVIERLKDRALLPEEVTHAELERLGVHAKQWPLILQLYRDYQARLITLGARDFGDLILSVIQIFRLFPDILEQYAQKFRYILVDEYQDINVAQYLLLKLLSTTTQNLCCVGDDDQSIYGWRGAEVENILRFETDFPGTNTVRLETNYRSTPQILKAASSLIANNASRLKKNLNAAEKNADGEVITVQGLWDADEEARFVVGQIESLQKEGTPLSHNAILVRAGSQTRPLEERFILLGMPYRVVGATRFYDRLEIKDAIAYLKLVVLPQNSLAFERALNTPKRGLGPKVLQTLHELARHDEISLYDAAQRLVQSAALTGKARTSLAHFLRMLEVWQAKVGTTKPADLARLILDESGYTDFWKQETSPEASVRLENLKELVKAIEPFDHLTGFLEHVSLVADAASKASDDAVSVMTLHMAKGLEFENVFLTGWEEGLFPHGKSLNEKGQKGLEEERRLAYVGLTRAQKNIWITFAWNRRSYQGWQSCTPSRFIDELPRESINLQDHPPQKRARIAQGASSNTLPNASTFRPYQQVFHKVFGPGIVQEASQSVVDVLFESGERRKLLPTYLSTKKHP